MADIKAPKASIAALTVLITGPALGAQIVKTGNVKFRTVLGGMMLGGALFVLSMVDGEFAQWVGVIAAVTSFLVNGGPLFVALEKALR